VVVIEQKPIRPLPVAEAIDERIRESYPVGLCVSGGFEPFMKNSCTSWNERLERAGGLSSKDNDIDA
jgi:hypothetical protein